MQRGIVRLDAQRIAQAMPGTLSLAELHEHQSAQTQHIGTPRAEFERTVKLLQRNLGLTTSEISGRELKANISAALDISPPLRCRRDPGARTSGQQTGQQHNTQCMHWLHPEISTIRPKSLPYFSW